MKKIIYYFAFISFLIFSFALSGCSTQKEKTDHQSVQIDKSIYDKLFLAVVTENKEEVSKILKENNIDPNYQSIQYGTLLTTSAQTGNPEITKQIIDMGADVNKKDDSGQTALHWACQKGNIEVVKILLESKADFNIEDNNGNTPLKIAKTNHFQEIIKLLEDAGAKE